MSSPSSGSTWPHSVAPMVAQWQVRVASRNLIPALPGRRVVKLLPRKQELPLRGKGDFVQCLVWPFLQEIPRVRTWFSCQTLSNWLQWSLVTKSQHCCPKYCRNPWNRLDQSVFSYPTCRCFRSPHGYLDVRLFSDKYGLKCYSLRHPKAPGTCCILKRRHETWSSEHVNALSIRPVLPCSGSIIRASNSSPVWEQFPRRSMTKKRTTLIEFLSSSLV